MIVDLCETWLEEKDRLKVQKKLPKSHVWNSVYARKKKSRGRASGELLIGSVKDWGVQKKNRNLEMKEVEIGHNKNKVEGNGFEYFFMYNKGGGKKIQHLFYKIDKYCKGEGIIIRGDFNTRTEELGGNGQEEFEWGRRRVGIK